MKRKNSISDSASHEPENINLPAKEIKHFQPVLVTIEMLRQDPRYRDLSEEQLVEIQVIIRQLARIIYEAYAGNRLPAKYYQHSKAGGNPGYRAAEIPP